MTDRPLAALTTMGVGGPAGQLTEVHSAEELVATVKAADERGTPVLLLGGGSNVVASDDGFPGLVILIRSKGIEPSGNRLRIAAGHPWEGVVTYAVDHQLAGIECLAGIPGLTGATPIQNVGAYGQEMSDVVTLVRAYDRERGELRDLTPVECSFGYRTSRFKAEPGRWIVTEIELALRPGERGGPVRYGELSRALGLDSGAAESAELPKIRDAVLALRRSKGMVLDPADPDTVSSGSFFTNPVLDDVTYAALVERAGAPVPAFREPSGHKVPAAWLISRAGFPKGYGAGRARLSSKHSLAITNRGGATAGEVLALAREIRDGVRAQLGVTLVNEPVLIGESL